MSGFSREHRLAVLAISCFSLFIIGLDDTIVSIALPTIANGLHASVSGLQWIVDGYAVVLASLLVYGGAMADRFGRRRVFLIGLVTFTVGSALCSLAPTLGWLIAFRVLQATGGSMLNPVAVSIISSAYTNRGQRAQAIGVWVGMFGVGMALGPALGGVLMGMFGWRAIFWVNIPVGLCAIALTSAFVPESRGGESRRADPVAQLLVIVTMAAIVYAIIEGAYTHWGTTTIRGLFIGAGLTLATLVVWEIRRKDPLIEVRSFSSRSLSSAVVIGTCSFANLGGFLFLTSIYLQDVRGSSATHAGLEMLPTAIAMALCPSLAAWLTRTTGSARLALILGGMALMLSTHLMAGFTASSADIRLLLTFELFGIGMGMVNGQISVAAVSGMPPARAGLASGIASASRLVGQSLGVAVAGSLLTAQVHEPIRTAFTRAGSSAWHLLFGCACVVTAAGLLTTRPRARHRLARGVTQRRQPPRAAAAPAEQSPFPLPASPSAPPPALPRRRRASTDPLATVDS